MYKYMIPILLLLASCSKPHVSTFYCITALGTAKISSDQEDVKVGRDYIYYDRELSTLKIARSMCLEDVQK